jgi:hypothetical protein
MLAEVVVFFVLVAVVGVVGVGLGMLVARWIGRRSDDDEEPRVDD